MDVKCEICNSTFKTKSGLYKHKKNHHNEFLCVPRNFVCSVNNCNVGLKTIKDYLVHIKSLHQDFSLKYEEHNFSAREEFINWKCNTESLSISQFVQHIVYTSKVGKKITFICNRNGTFKPRGNGQRESNTQNTRKTTLSCPASMFVLIDSNGKYHVDYYATHIGHSNDIEHVNLNINDKLAIVKELKDSNLDKDMVIEKFKDGNRRINAIDKKEIDNIIQQFKLFDYDHLDRNDLKSLRKKIASSKDDSSNPFKRVNIQTDKNASLSNKRRQSRLDGLNSRNHNRGKKADWRIDAIEHNMWSIDTKKCKFLITLLDKQCKQGDKCRPLCKRCRICRHMLKCSCDVYQRQNIICKHLHFFSLKKIVKFDFPVPPTDIDTEDDTFIQDNDDNTCIQDNENHVMIIHENVDVEQMQNERDQLLGRVLKLNENGHLSLEKLEKEVFYLKEIVKLYESQRKLTTQQKCYKKMTFE